MGALALHSRQSVNAFQQKEGRKGGRREGREGGRKEGREEGRKEGRKGGRNKLTNERDSNQRDVHGPEHCLIAQFPCK